MRGGAINSKINISLGRCYYEMGWFQTDPTIINHYQLIISYQFKFIRLVKMKGVGRSRVQVQAVLLLSYCCIKGIL